MLELLLDTYILSGQIKDCEREQPAKKQARALRTKAVLMC